MARPGNHAVDANGGRGSSPRADADRPRWLVPEVVPGGLALDAAAAIAGSVSPVGRRRVPGSRLPTEDDRVRRARAEPFLTSRGRSKPMTRDV